MFKIIRLFIKNILNKENKHVLIILQNNNELRATGGFITSVCDISLCKLSFRINFLDTFKDLNKVSKIKAPHILERMLKDNHFKGLTLRDANFDPDFNTSAKRISNIYNEIFPKNDVTGCIAVNYLFIENLVEILGKIKINNELITRNNLFSFILSKTCDIDRHDLKSINNRKTILNNLYKRIFKKCIFSIHKWPRINRLIKNSYQNKNIQIWDKNNKEKSVYIRENNEDFLSVVENNYLGGKSNRYLKRIIFRDIDLNKNEANISLKVLWEHTGKYNYPVSSDYKAHVKIYLPGNAVDISKKISFCHKDFQIVDYIFKLRPGERNLLQINYQIKDNWLNKKDYKFKFIKQSGIENETIFETYRLPVSHYFTNSNIIHAKLAENTCIVRNDVKKDFKLSLSFDKNPYGPRIISHDFIKPHIVEVKFNEPVKFTQDGNNIEFKGKRNSQAYEVEKVNMGNKDKSLYIHLKKIPKEENKFYSITLSNIINKAGQPLKNAPRTVTAVYRESYFKNHAPE